MHVWLEQGSLTLPGRWQHCQASGLTSICFSCPMCEHIHYIGDLALFDVRGYSRNLIWCRCGFNEFIRLVYPETDTEAE